MLAAVLALVTPARAQQARDVGLLTTVNGDASYQNPGGRKQTVSSMIKMRENDVVELGPNARLQIVYFASGVVESWQGAASFVVGAEKGGLKSGTAPASRKIPATMVESLAKGPQVMTDIRQRTGMTVTRSIRDLSAARKRYESERSQTSIDDPLPEIALFVELYEARQFPEAASILDTALKRVPNDPVWKDLLREYRSKLGS